MRKQPTFFRNVADTTGTAKFVTPQSGNIRSTRSQHVPTPKMSTRKKALFCSGKNAVAETSPDPQEDSDLGPMSPLKFSNSPKRTAAKALNITSFRNILGNATPESDRSLSPDYERRFSHSERYEILSTSYDKENNMSDEETRHSFPKETPRVRPPAESALLDETNSNSLSLLMNSDLNIIDEKTHIHKTPGLTEGYNLNKEPKISFRKLSASDNLATPSASKDRKTPLGDMTNDCKARTSLTFNDLRPISTKSFYSSSGHDSATKPQISRSSQLYSSSCPKTVTKRASSGQRKRLSGKTRGNSIRLGSFNRGVFHKIKKPVSKKTKNNLKKLSTSQVLASTSVVLNNSGEKAVKSSKSTPTSPLKQSKCREQEPQLAQQMARVRKILRNIKNPIEQARPLSLSKSMTDLTNCSFYSDDRNDHARSEKCTEEEDHDSFESDENEDNESEEGAKGGGKFFKANSSRRIKREYKIINNVSATVRKGGKISINRNKERKRKFQSIFDEEFDFETEQLEVDDIISKLNQPQKDFNLMSSASIASPVESKNTPQISEKTVQIEIVDAVHSEISNDEPIPMQSNVIFVDNMSPFNTASEESSGSVTETVACIPITAQHESPMAQIRSMTSELVITKAVNVSDQFRDTQPASDGKQEKLFPIFHKDHQRTVESRESMTDSSFGLFDPNRRRHKNVQNWRPIGSNQYQIDAGQKEYGAQQCSGCGLVYSVHEPEEELIHENYHSSQHVLKFSGWTNEPVIARVPEWDVTGRILAITMAESKQKLQKIVEVLAVVDRELGYIEPCALMLGSVVYLAVARSTILGVCVAQPQKQANRLLTIEGIEGFIDCCTLETYPAKCGISRIWVSPNFRCHGVARTMLTVLKSHFIFGHLLSYDEIAFSAPTEAGKRLAENVTGRKDFLIYM